jgi:peptidoglycan/xylan/chitin deacetylase (PgdA/CDA1 family)
MAVEATQRILPVLTYHSIDASGSVISTRPSVFECQIKSLADAGWQTLTIDEMLAGRGSGSWPHRSVVLTFDDGYRNVLEVAAPILSQHRFHAIVFVVADRAGGTAAWRDQPAAMRAAPLMDWRELRGIVSMGFALGAHSLTHPRLPMLAADAADRELGLAKRIIEEQCEVNVTAFAYPYGARTIAIEQLAAQHYRAAFGTRLGFATPSSRCMDLERVDAYYLRRFASIERLDSRMTGAYILTRRLARALRNVLTRQPTQSNTWA